MARYRPHAIVTPTPQELAGWVGGALLSFDGNPARLTGLGTLDEAGPSEVSFVAGRKNYKEAGTSSAGLLIAPRGFEPPDRPRIEVDSVWEAVATVMNRLFPKTMPEPGVHPTAVLGRDVKVGKDASIGPFCAIGDRAEIGDGAILGPHCSIDADCRVGPLTRFFARVTLQGIVHVGSRVLIHPGAVLGADGFRYEAGPAGILKIPQVGLVRIEDEVEIGANTTIDRPFLHETRIGRGTKIDNQVQIGHNCNIGCYVIIAGCTAVAGSVTIEDHCIIGGQVAIVEGLTIGRGSMIAGFAGVGKDFPPASSIGGIPARPYREWFKSVAHIQRLPRLVERVERLERALSDAKAEDKKD